MVTTILSWVLTYALHSTVLILSVWLVCRYVPRLSLATQEILWKLALGGAIVTSAVQLGAGVQPPWGHLAMPQALAGETHAAVAPSVAATEVAPAMVRHRSGDLTIVATRTAVPVATAPATTATTTSNGAWPWVLLSLVLAGSVLGLVRVALGARSLRRQLAGRRDVIEDPLLETWLALCNKAQLTKRVRLSTSPALPSPVALMRREVCVPERAIDGLTPPQQESMLAHELAHVLRRDPAWLVASTIVEALFFFQPLHHLVRRKIEEVSEFQCDDWAARHSGTGVHLAKCLAEVAAWVERQPPTPMAATMASARSPIIRRITRLLDDRRRVVAEFKPAWRVGAAVGMLGAVAWLAPAVTPSAQAAPSVPLATAGLAALVPPQRIVVEDVAGSGLHDRARVRIVGAHETVELEVAAPRALPSPPPPPLPPTPPPRSSELRIVIEGGWSMDAWPFGGPMNGFIGIEMDGLDLLFEDDPFSLEMEAIEDAIELREDLWERQAEAAEEAAEAAAEAAERHAEAAEAALEARRDAAQREREAAEFAREASRRDAASASPWGSATAAAADAELIAL
jgi:beta-lactamase regulating signal transducer with metallopeptidase domain